MCLGFARKIYGIRLTEYQFRVSVSSVQHHQFPVSSVQHQTGEPEHVSVSSVQHQTGDPEHGHHPAYGGVARLIGIRQL